MDASTIGYAAPSLVNTPSLGASTPSSQGKPSAMTNRSPRPRVVWLSIDGVAPRRAAPLEDLLTENTIEDLPVDMRTDNTARRLLEERTIRWRSSSRRSLSADVDGQRVTIQGRGRSVGFSCACGYRKDFPCAHAVAVARAWVEQRTRKSELSTIKAWLNRLDRDDLHRVLLRQLFDAELRRRLCHVAQRSGDRVASTS